GINGILADEMGLGKTVQTMSFLAYLSERFMGPFLIISPSSTLHNWQQEFTKFVPELNVLPYWGNSTDRKSLRTFWNAKKNNFQSRTTAPFHVLITSYQLVIRDFQYFKRIAWQYMVLDEAQAIKSVTSQRWKTLLSFSCRNRLLLTGTPMQNTMAELWALLHFIMPVLFDSHEEFNEWFSKDIEGRVENKATVDQTHLSRLHMILKPFMLRRTKKEVEKELTDKVEIQLKCGLSIRQKMLYEILKKKLSTEDQVISHMKNNNLGTSPTISTSGSSDNTSIIKNINQLMNLVVQFRKVCNHPDLFEKCHLMSPAYIPPLEIPLPKLFLDVNTSSVGFEAITPIHGWSHIFKPDPSQLIVDSGKMLVLHSLLSKLKAEGHRVLIYSQMTKMIDILEIYLTRCRYRFVRLDGSSKMADRRETVSNFQTNPDIFVFLLSTRAGGIGINLTAADTVIFYDSDWNPTVDQQAMDRAHRLGQTRQVTVYRLICDGTVEERILQRAQQKSMIQQMIISGKNKQETLKPKEIMKLLLGEEDIQQRLKSRNKDTLLNSTNISKKI
ncbi:chromatin-remodeling ATPase INO80-like, partial [Pempheris klunzingeri]|uniref:chromatin-remodeling ATPase INO80-like n=1 Tax=Pempheris klunzingeri TaxID=3127111 RepID=UPI00398099DD